MRRAGYDSGWHINDNGEVIGFSLHGNACTEHECGVKGLRSAMGVATPFRNGVSDRVNTQLPNTFRFFEVTHEGQPTAWLMVSDHRYPPTATLDTMSSDGLRFSNFRKDRENKHEAEKDDFVGAWDSNGFLVGVRGQGNIDRLKKMAKAFETQQAAFGNALIGEDPRTRVGGLTIVRANQVAPEMAAKALAEDQEAKRLLDASDSIKPQLEELLKAAGKSWYAMTPAWNKDKTEVLFHLNPTQPDDYQSGWFTVEEIKAWARNEGPVMVDKPLRNISQQWAKPWEQLRKDMRKAKIETPFMSVGRSTQDPDTFVIKAQYNQAPAKGWTQIPQGEHTLDEMRALVPKPTPKPRSRSPRA